MSRGAKARGPKPAGTAIRAAGKNGPQLAKTNGKQWTDEAEAAFLDALAASCNVRRAAEAIGYTSATLYWRRRGDPAFAGRWQAALEQGYSRIEALLIERAEDTLSGRMPNPELPIPPMTVKEAIDLLRLHHHSVKGGGPRRPGRRAVVRPIEELRANILARLAAMDEHERDHGAETGAGGGSDAGR